MNERSFIYIFMSKPLSPEKYTQIIEAAEKLIAEVGFGGLSMQKVANRAGIAAGTIYRYFTDKEHLLRQVRKHVAHRIADAIQHGLDADMSIKQKHRTICLNIWNLNESNTSVISNRAQYESLPTLGDKSIQSLEKQLFSQVHQILDQGKQQGFIKPLDNETLMHLSFSPIVMMLTKQRQGILSIQDSIDDIINASWDAIITH